ncbi:MAG: hypothetical protein GY804_13750 [Alphaproteobacteria bacterium]|nr:hypothetical protein [Alphaproteobacteria bacterium]
MRKKFDGDVIFIIEDGGIQYVPDDKSSQVDGNSQSQLNDSAVPGNMLLQAIRGNQRG